MVSGGRIPHHEEHLGAVDACKMIRCLNQLVDNAGLHGRVAGIRHDVKLGLGPGLGQGPGRRQRRHHIIAAVNDDTRNVLQLFCALFQQPVVAGKETAIDEIVAFDPGEGVDKVIFIEAGRGGQRPLDGEGFALPA